MKIKQNEWAFDTSMQLKLIFKCLNAFIVFKEFLVKRVCLFLLSKYYILLAGLGR